MVKVDLFKVEKRADVLGNSIIIDYIMLLDKL